MGTLYNTLAVLQTIGSLIAGPLMSISFRRGLDLGGGWIGLPFLGASILFMVTTVAIFSVRLPVHHLSEAEPTTPEAEPTTPGAEPMTPEAESLVDEMGSQRA